MNKFKIGDKVVCVDPSLTCPDLQLGVRYTVSDVNSDGTSVKVGSYDWWFANRFEPEPVQKQAEPKPRLRPRQEHYQERLVEILEAMVWAAKMGIVIPDDWDCEYDVLRESLNDVYDPDELLHESV